MAAAECCAVILAAAVGVLAFGATPLALAALGLCALTMPVAVIALGRLERRGPRD